LHSLHQYLGNDFIRINRSDLINKNKITKVDKNFQNIVLCNGAIFKISRRRRKQVALNFTLNK
jgi:DNA-binding LytR/AlgR family response regulator